MKKLLRAVCVLVILALLMPVFAAEPSGGFSDQKDIGNLHAVQMLVDLKLISGYEDGSFRPAQPVTRAETAKLIAILSTELPQPAPWISFGDTKGSWAEDYISYCAGAGIVSGSGGMFRPKDNVTGAELAKMLLITVGGSAQNYVGAAWLQAVRADAEASGLYRGFDGDDTKPISRDDACLLIYNAMQLPATVAAADGTRLAALDELMNPQTYLEMRFGAVRYCGVLVANEYGALEGESRLDNGMSKLEGHKPFAVSTEKSMLGQNVVFYARFGLLLGCPVLEEVG